MTEEHIVRTACAANCGGRSLLNCTVRDGRLVNVTPAPMPDERYTNLCVRCLTLPQWVYSADRITAPMRRVGERGSGQFEPITWDEALDVIASTFEGIRAQHGPSSIAFTGTSGASQLGDYGRLAALLQASHFYGGVDMAVHMGLNAMFGYKGTFGQNANEWTDRGNAKLIVVWGNNPAETSMTTFRHLLDAQESGSQVVVIDPRYSATAMHANWWIAPRPGTDLALALGMLNVIIAEGFVDEPFALAHSCAPLLVREDDGRWLRASDLGLGTDKHFMVWDLASDRPKLDGSAPSAALRGSFPIAETRVTTAFSLLERLVAEHTPDRVEAITGIAAKDVRDLALMYGTVKPSTIGFGYGVDRYFHADLLTRAAGTLAVLTGNIGRPGAGVGVQSHGHGSHETDVRGGTLAERARTKQALPEWARVTAVPLIEVGDRELPVHAVFSAGDWMNQRVADHNRIKRWAKGVDFLVAVDHFWQTTAQWSDIVLPASTFLEGVEPYRDLVATRNCLVLRSTVIDPVGDSKPDRDIERALAERLGLGDYFTTNTEEVLRAMLDGSAPGAANITLDSLVAAGGAERLDVPRRPNVQYEDLRFGTPTGRAEFYLEKLVPFGEQLPVWKTDFEASRSSSEAVRYPLVFIQGHARQRAHSTFHNTAWTLEIWPEPVVELGPREAAARGIASGDEVEVFNDRGRVVVLAMVNPDYPDGMCNIGEGWKQHQFRAGNLQELTNPRINEAQYLLWSHANIPFFDTRVEIRRSEGGVR